VSERASERASECPSSRPNNRLTERVSKSKKAIITIKYDIIILLHNPDVSTLGVCSDPEDHGYECSACSTEYDITDDLKCASKFNFIIRPPSESWKLN